MEDMRWQVPSQQNCFICLEVAKKPGVCPCCKKMVCSQCIFSWLKSHHNCPYCKMKLLCKNIEPPPSGMVDFCRLYHCKVTGCEAQRRNKLFEEVWNSITKLYQFYTKKDEFLDRKLAKSIANLDNAKEEAVLALQRFCRNTQNQIQKEYAEQRRRIEDHFLKQSEVGEWVRDQILVCERILEKVTPEQLIQDWHKLKSNFDFQQLKVPSQITQLKTVELFQPQLCNISITIHPKDLKVHSTQGEFQPWVWQLLVHPCENAFLSAKIRCLPKADTKPSLQYFSIRLEGAGLTLTRNFECWLDGTEEKIVGFSKFVESNRLPDQNFTLSVKIRAAWPSTMVATRKRKSLFS